MKHSHIGIVLITLIALAGCQITVDDRHVDSSGTTDSPTQGSDSNDNGTQDEADGRSVSLYWSAPMERVNSESLPNTEIAGYEIRYRKDGETQYTSIVIDDAATTQYHIDNLEPGDHRFEVAVFDTSGLYSEFVVAEL